MKRATLTLDDGTQFVGWHFGFPSSSSGEVGTNYFTNPFCQNLVIQNLFLSLLWVSFKLKLI